MDPFTQRMLERARARQEKIDQKLASSGQAVPRRKPLTENITRLKTTNSPAKSPRESIVSPRKSLKEPVKSASPVKTPNRRSSRNSEVVASPQKRNDVIVTRKEFGTPKGSCLSKRNTDVSVEINIMHRDDIQIEVQVEERDAPISVLYETNSDSGSNVTVKEITEDSSSKVLETVFDTDDKMGQRAGLRHNVKSRLDRLGVLYSDKEDLSSPIQRTEADFTCETPPSAAEKAGATPRPDPKKGNKKFGRLAALADQINNWEDDLSHLGHQPEAVKKSSKPVSKNDKLDASTLDVSIHSLNDINKAVAKSKSNNKQSKQPVNSGTFSKPSSTGHQRFDKNIVAKLEPTGEATPSAACAPAMATLVAATPPTVAKKPSIKKYRAPTPPSKSVCESEKDKENVVNDNDAADVCVQTKPDSVDDGPQGSPVVKRFAPKLNGERNSVLSRAAMFEAGSPKAKDPAEMSLRERKALFEKNKGAAIVPKAPFGLAPSTKTLHGDHKADQKPSKPASVKSTPSTSSSNSKENIPEDNTSLVSVGGGIKGKLAALFSKEQTISETTIANKFKQEREREMEMLQNRFHYKPQGNNPNDSDDETSENDPSEKAPLMGSSISLSQLSKKPEIIANVPKVNFEDKARSEEEEKDVVAAQPNKRRSSQDSPVVLSVLEDVKRIKVTNNKKETQANGTVIQQPASLYPHLSDIETDTSHTQDEYSECGGSSSEANDNMNKSDNWADTSFGRDVMNVVKKNNSSYQKAVRESDCDTSNSDLNSELDDMLDEALNEEESEGPTPPKLNKNANSLSSKSFEYSQGSPVKKHFKSPLKVDPMTPKDKGSELVHTVSFYRRHQNASSQATTPHRTVRHTSPERDIPATPECGGGGGVTTVRQRLKELQAEINKQQSVISQASQALNLCAATIEFSGSTEQAEGERLLLLATHRRQACLHEVQRLQVEGAGAAAAIGRASLHMQGLTVPLRRDYMRHLNADGAVGHYAVCLLKCRDRVLATSMQLTQPSSNLLHFPDEIRMEGLASDFKVTVEVYLLQASKEILPHNVKYHIHNKKPTNKLLTPKKVSELKAPRVQSPAGPMSVRTPQLQPHGYCIFALAQANRNTFTLNKVPCASPLEGSINLHIKARVQVPPPPPHSAFLTAFDDVSGLGAWHRRWFHLEAPRLSYWKYPDDVQKKMPIGDIDLSTVVSDKITKAPRDLCARPHTLLVECSVPAGLLVPESGSLVYVRRPDGGVLRRHMLAADTPADRDLWLERLNQALDFVRCTPAEED